MYEEFYGLTEKPFTIQPDPAFLYWGRGHRLAYAMLEYGVLNQAGISVITGEVGCGKTTLIHRLLDQLSDTHTVALLSNIQSGRGELLSWVLMGFGEPYSGSSHVEMFAQLQQFFISEYAKGKRVVLIIDEAQNLSVDMLEELRMLSNINAGKDQLLQLILAGQPQLKDLLGRPDMLQLAQRIGSDFHLTPLSREEVRSYIDTRLTIAGARHQIFTDKATDVIAEQSRGVPRVINIIADTALVYGFSSQEESVTDEVVKSVIRDKLDFGVFGLASSPDVRLSEWPESHSASGFLRDSKPAKKKRNSPSAKRAEAAPPKRPIRNIGIKMVAPAGAQDDDGDGSAELGVPNETIGNLKDHSETRPTHKETRVGVAEPSPRQPAPAGNPMQSMGIVVVGAAAGLSETTKSLPPGIRFVIVTENKDEAARAREVGYDVVEIAQTGAGGGRVRNAGYRRLKKVAPDIEFVQFIECGVALDSDWFSFAHRFLSRRSEVAALEGVTESNGGGPSIFSRVLAISGNEGESEIQAAGPNAVFRADAFEAAGGFRGDIVADETADLCIRLRRRGAHIWRSDAVMASRAPEDMTLSDWRRKSASKGYAYAAGAALHGAAPERLFVKDQARAMMWGAFFPALLIVGSIGAFLFTQFAVIGGEPGLAALAVFGVGFMIYVLKAATIALKRGPFNIGSWAEAFLKTYGYFGEAGGVMRYWFNRKPAN